MFSLFSKKKIFLDAPVSGIIVPLNKVSDQVFASESMGKGIAIDFDGENVYAPSDGKVIALFPTGHAIGIEVKGVQYIVHVGIDTVNLNGEGFTARVQQGDSINKGDLLIEVDSNYIREKSFDPITIIVFPEGDEFELIKNTGHIQHGQEFIKC